MPTAITINTQIVVMANYQKTKKRRVICQSMAESAWWDKSDEINWLSRFVQLGVDEDFLVKHSSRYNQVKGWVARQGYITNKQQKTQSVINIEPAEISKVMALLADVT